MSVHKGQMEAGSSLGLSRGQTLRMIVVPQAMRVILPPLTNQYLNLTKNSSLAVAIGYPDLVSVFAGTALSQTGQAIEIISITMGVYLLISLVTSEIRRKTPMVMPMISIACPVWLSVVPANTETRSG